jgi:hypothetical protein
MSQGEVQRGVPLTVMVKRNQKKKKKNLMMKSSKILSHLMWLYALNGHIFLTYPFFYADYENLPNILLLCLFSSYLQIDKKIKFKCPIR